MDAGILDWLQEDDDGWMASENMQNPQPHPKSRVMRQEDGSGPWLDPLSLFRFFFHGPESAWGRGHEMAQHINVLAIKASGLLDPWDLYGASREQSALALPLPGILLSHKPCIFPSSLSPFCFFHTSLSSMLERQS